MLKVAFLEQMWVNYLLHLTFRRGGGSPL